MPLTEAQYQVLIPTEVGDTGVVAENISILWAKHDDKSLRLRYLWAKRDAIEMLMGSVWQDYSVGLASGARMNLKEKYDNLQGMLAQVTEEIKCYRGNRQPQMGEITVTAPIEASAGFPDPNSGRYRGDPTVLRANW